MGGCATKPKVLKDGAAGAPMPEAQKEESAAEDLTAVKEGAAGADDEANKRRSLSNLFKESEEKSLEDGKDETYETKQATDLSAPNSKETEKPKCAEEQTPAPVVVDAPAKTEAQKTQEVASTAEVPKLETSCEEKIEDVKPTTEVRTEEEKPTEDSQKSDTPVEKKTENQNPEKKTEQAPASTLEKMTEN
ncbi:PREDICTED: retinitis pigmentosa 1-like 1 protein isoform X2 [Ipomoea nil]|uniref:retinitis pigmentosa 1-like 1 protein isoform X2 n=1 Tax=Ipomoea nil TaxID=35883 RepID=UPI000901E2DC|nr:PREDICTED: retinitis pigmentosa 1-like 1 protein isoform X2 [Ipomoea nil]